MVTRFLLTSPGEKEGVIGKFGLPDSSDVYAGSLPFLVWQPSTNSNWAYASSGSVTIHLFGTYSFRGQFGMAAAEEALSEFAKQGLASLSKTIDGTYVCFVVTERETVVFVDGLGTYPLFFKREGDNTHSIANDITLLCGVDCRGIGDFEALAAVLLFTPIPPSSMLSNVSRLLGTQSLHLQDGRLEIREMPRSRQMVELASNFEAAVAQVADKLVSQTLNMVDSNRDQSLFMTGGLDTRTVLAILLASDQRPTLLYGVGDSILTNTKSSDRDIVSEIAKQERLQMRTLNWSTDWNLDRDRAVSNLRRFGLEVSLCYGGSSAFLDSMEEVSDSQQTWSGYGGETLRLREWAYAWLEERDSINVDDFISDFVLGGGYGFRRRMKKLPLVSELRSCLMKDYRRLLDHLGIVPVGVNEVSTEEWTNLEYAFRRFVATKWLQVQNTFTASVNPFFAPEVFELLRQIPNDWRRHGKFQLAVIKYLHPSLANVDVFSHTLRYSVAEGQLRQNQFDSSERLMRGVLRGLGISRLDPPFSLFFLSKADRKSLGTLQADFVRGCQRSSEFPVLRRNCSSLKQLLRPTEMVYLLQFASFNDWNQTSSSA
jgi:hypothetical protein